MKKSFALAALAAAAILAGCRRTDVRDFTVHVPELPADGLPKIQAALAKYGGVQHDSLKLDPASRTVSMRYDSMQIAKKNIEIAIAKAGYAANGVTPESVGAKPAK